MSHFTVGVLINEKGKNLEELLAPYQENNMDDCPKEYLKFNDVQEEYEQDYKEKTEEIKQKYPTFELYMEEYCGYHKDEEMNKYGYWENPNAQWDWYQVGGRWSGRLLTKDGEKVDYAKLKDIDWDTMFNESKEKAEKTWDSNPEGIDRYFAGIQSDDTRDSFIKRVSEFSTYAVITSDGEWHSKGKMGWFGCSSETEKESSDWTFSFYDKFIKDADGELILAVVDCHI